jgi:hypothetical protein
MPQEPNQPLSTDIEDFGTESEADSHAIKIISEPKDVSDKDIFKLAKWILAVCAGFFLLIIILRVSLDQQNKGAIEVWEYAKVLLNSIISLVLGLYFGAKKRDK